MEQFSKIVLTVENFVLLGSMPVHRKNTVGSASQKNAAIGPWEEAVSAPSERRRCTWDWSSDDAARETEKSGGTACGTRAAAV